jgi:hypothetical protein
MKIILSTAIALLALSGVALAERSHDLRESDTYCGKFMAPSVPGRLNCQGSIDASPLRVIDVPYTTQGKEFDREQRRLDEKNGSNG